MVNLGPLSAEIVSLVWDTQQISTGFAHSQPSHIGCIPYFHIWSGLCANLGCRSETCCMRLAESTGRQKSPKIRHLRTIAQRCLAISSQLKHVSTIGKNLLNSNTSLTCPYNMLNFALQQVEYVECKMHRCTILLKNKIVINDAIIMHLTFCSDGKISHRYCPLTFTPVFDKNKFDIVSDTVTDLVNIKRKGDILQDAMLPSLVLSCAHIRSFLTVTRRYFKCISCFFGKKTCST